MLFRSQGGVATTTIDSTQQFEVVMDCASQADANAFIVALSTTNTAVFNFSGRATVYGAYCWSTNQVYWTRNTGSYSEGLVSGTYAYPKQLKLKKSGNDMLLQVSTDGGSTWTTVDTRTGVLSGLGTLYLIAMTGGSGSLRMRAKIQ